MRGALRRGRPKRIHRPSEEELAEHLRTVHGLVLPPADGYIDGHRYPHLVRLHREAQIEPDADQHTHPWS